MGGLFVGLFLLVVYCVSFDSCLVWVGWCFGFEVWVGWCV